VRKPIEEERLFDVMATLLGLRFTHGEASPAARVPAAVEPSDLAGLPADLREELVKTAEVPVGSTVAVVGLQGFGYTLVGIAGTLVAGAVLGRLLAVRQATGILVAVGTAICGGSAIAAAAPAIGADDDETSAALGIVFLLNATALLLFPPIGHWLGLSEHAFGLWAALAIHDTSSVVGAAATYGPGALTIATTTKLARALWIVPVTLALGAWAVRREGAPRGPVRAKRPWFILGFLATAAAVSFLPAIQPAGRLVAAAAQRMLVLTLFLLGLGLSREAVARVGARPFVLGLLLWFLAAGATLGAILAGAIR